jgi:hypothetical protein
MLLVKANSNRMARLYDRKAAGYGATIRGSLTKGARSYHSYVGRKAGKGCLCSRERKCRRHGGDILF